MLRLFVMMLLVFFPLKIYIYSELNYDCHVLPEAGDWRRGGDAVQLVLKGSCSKYTGYTRNISIDKDHQNS